MLRADKKAEIVKLPLNLRRLFTGRYALASGKRTFDVRWSKAAVDAIVAQQAESPVELVRHDRARLLGVQGLLLLGGRRPERR